MKRSWQHMGLCLLLVTPRSCIDGLSRNIAAFGGSDRDKLEGFSHITLRSSHGSYHVFNDESTYVDDGPQKRRQVKQEYKKSSKMTVATNKQKSKSKSKSATNTPTMSSSTSSPTQSSTSASSTSSPTQSTTSVSSTSSPTQSTTSTKSKSKSGKGGGKSSGKGGNTVPTCAPTGTPSVVMLPTTIPLLPTNAPLNVPTIMPTSTTIVPLPANVPTAAPIPLIPIATIGPNVSPVTASPVLTPAPMSIPIGATTAPMMLPSSSTPFPAMIPVVTLVPIITPTVAPVAPVVPTPTSGTPVMATPFNVNYTPSSNTATIEDFQAASLATCTHIEQYIIEIFDLTPFISLEDVACMSTTTSTSPTTISYTMNAVFGVDSLITPSSDNIDELISVALSSPEVLNLITVLNALPTTNPLSQTTGVIYDASAPLKIAVPSTIPPTAIPTSTFDFESGASSKLDPSLIGPSTEFPSSQIFGLNGQATAAIPLYNDKTSNSNSKAKGMGMNKVPTAMPIAVFQPVPPTAIQPHPTSISKSMGKGMGMGMGTSKIPSTAPRPPSCTPTQSPKATPSTSAPIAPILAPMLAPVIATISPITTAPILVPSTAPNNTPVKAPTTAPLLAPMTGPTAAPLLAPTAVPTVFPVKAPTTAPLLAPVISPTTAPLLAPVTGPIAAPLVAPTAVPIVAPVKAPTDAPLLAPVIAPTTAPLVVPVIAPTTTPLLAPVTGPTAAPLVAPTTAPLLAPVKAPTTTPLFAPVTRPAAAPLVAPTTAPTTVPLLAPVKAPTLAPVTIPVPVPVPVPIAGILVRAPIFNVVYSPTPTSATTIDSMFASDITCTHVKDSLNANFVLIPFINVADIQCRPISTSSTPPTSTIQFELFVVFAQSSTIVLMPNEIEQLTSIAFEMPQVNRLVNALKMLPSTNPFSSTTSTVYSMAPGPIRAPDELVSVDSSNATEISGTFAVSVAGFVGILLLMITAAIRRCRSNSEVSSRHLNPPRKLNQRFNNVVYVSKSTPAFQSGTKNNGIVDFLSSHHAEYMGDSRCSSHDDNDPLLLPSYIRTKDTI